MSNMIREPKPLPEFSKQNVDINETLKLNDNMMINDIEKFWVCMFHFYYITFYDMITIDITIGKS